MLASLEDVRLENRRLLEKEKQLQASLDLTEEQLRTLQTENSSLLSHLKGYVYPPFPSLPLPPLVGG